ncbi:hypothetical protein HanRHA438_Chr09g0382881 [Helianthus annuus]|nr:hypothetical protein HanRHA438_Chr09g0382881 [Helianthus annuus]
MIYMIKSQSNADQISKKKKNSNNKKTNHINIGLCSLSFACCQCCCKFFSLIDQENDISSCNVKRQSTPISFNKPYELEHSLFVLHFLFGIEQSLLQWQERLLHQPSLQLKTQRMQLMQVKMAVVFWVMDILKEN